MASPSPRRLGAFFAVLVWIGTVPLVAAPATPPPTDADAESFRLELAALTEELAGIEGVDAAAVERLRAKVGTLSPEALAGLQGRLSGFSRWRGLPRTLQSLADLRDERRERLRAELRASLAPPEPTAATSSDPADLPYGAYPGMVQSEEELRQLEEFREDFLFFIATLGAFEPLVESPDFAERVRRVERRIEEVPSLYLPKLRRMYYRQAPFWKRDLSRGMGAAGTEASARGLFPELDSISCNFGCPCDFDCCTRVCVPLIGCSKVCIPGCEALEDLCNVACDGIEALCGEINDLIDEVNDAIGSVNDLFDDGLSAITGVFSEITGVLDDIEGFFEGLWDSVESFVLALYDEIIGALPTGMSGALAILSALGEEGFAELAGLAEGSSEAQAFWSTYLQTEEVAVFLLSLTCDDLGLSIGTDVTLFGEVGSARAEWVCKRGVDWFNEYIDGRIPDDKEAEVAFGIAYKTFFFFPLKYFCACFEHQSALSFAVAQTDHVTLVETLFDEDLASRADDAGMETLRSQLDDLSSDDIAGVQDGVDEAAAQTEETTADVAVADDLVDDISTAQTGQSELIDDFLSQTLRLRIEENLLAGEDDDAVALFQSPEAFEGFLEVVHEIVTDTVQMTGDAGESTFVAEDYLLLADQQRQEGTFEKAYENYRNAYREAVKQQ